MIKDYIGDYVKQLIRRIAVSTLTGPRVTLTLTIAHMRITAWSSSLGVWCRGLLHEERAFGSTVCHSKLEVMKHYTGRTLALVQASGVSLYSTPSTL